jgi:hypothetical protein
MLMPVPPLPASMPLLAFMPPLPDIVIALVPPLACDVPPDPVEIGLPAITGLPPEPVFEPSSAPSAAQPAAATQHNHTAKTRCFARDIAATAKRSTLDNDSRGRRQASICWRPRQTSAFSRRACRAA